MESSNRPRPRVIVRAWGDEPVALVVYHVDSKDNIVLVGSEDCKRPIGLPGDQVFVFEEQTFNRLRTAYEIGQSDELLNIYASCIRYQNNVDSPHGQERLSHPACAAKGHDQ